MSIDRTVGQQQDAVARSRSAASATADASGNGTSNSSATGRSTPVNGSSQLTSLNESIARFEEQENLSPEDQRQLDSLQAARDKAIVALTGNADVTPYSRVVAAIAQRDGITYNAAAGNINRTNAALNIAEPPVVIVEKVPWETPVVSARVDELMTDDGLSFDAAVVIAMSERPRKKFEHITEVLADIIDLVGGRQATEKEWETTLAGMASGSSAEIAAWAQTNEPGSTVTFGATADQITVSMRDGQVVVSDGTTERVFDPAASDRIVIAGGGGNDIITVDEDVTAKLTLVGGAGNDTIVGGNGHGIIIGGAGDDNIEGGRANDLIIGGDGADVVYGAAGKDIIIGGDDRDSLYGGRGSDIIVGDAGNDYIDGGSSRDALFGGDDDDVISGGKSGDVISGENGNDTLIGASGNDLYTDAESGDTVIAEDDEVVPDDGAAIERVNVLSDAGSEAITIDPSSRDRFRNRVNDDLETLRSLSAGQAMLTGLDTEARTDGHTTTLEELQFVENGFAQASGPNRFLAADGTPASGESTTIRFNPSVNIDLNTSGATPPIVILFHEFAHAYNNATGTMIPGTYNPSIGALDPNNGTNLRELQAVGIAIDHDNDPSTPVQLQPQAQPFELTENGLRTELNIEQRPVY